MKIHNNQRFTLKPVGRRAAEFQRLGSGMAAEFAGENWLAEFCRGRNFIN
jgi:hypothetical protein